MWALVAEALFLRASIAGLGLSEYIDFRLYERDLSFTMKRQFSGARFQAALEETLVDDLSKFISQDKVTMYALLEGLGAPIPAVRAVFRTPRTMPYLCLADEVQLIEFLSVESHLPVYLKEPVRSFVCEAYHDR